MWVFSGCWFAFVVMEFDVCRFGCFGFGFVDAWLVGLGLVLCWFGLLLRF